MYCFLYFHPNYNSLISSSCASSYTLILPKYFRLINIIPVIIDATESAPLTIIHSTQSPVKYRTKPITFQIKPIQMTKNYTTLNQVMRQGLNTITIKHKSDKQNIFIDWNIISIVEVLEFDTTNWARSTLPAESTKLTWKNIIKYEGLYFKSRRFSENWKLGIVYALRG